MIVEESKSENCARRGFEGAIGDATKARTKPGKRPGTEHCDWPAHPHRRVWSRVMSVDRLVIYGASFLAPLVLYLAVFRRRAPAPPQPSPNPAPAPAQQPKSIMQAENPNLAPPKDDPFTLEDLKAFDGTDPSKPIYVSIKGKLGSLQAGRGRSVSTTTCEVGVIEGDKLITLTSHHQPPSPLSPDNSQLSCKQSSLSFS